MTDATVNSESYWDQRFATDWEVADGRAQSRYFGSVAHALMPAWLVQASRIQALHWCDWGCAMGDGTEQLAKMFPGIRFTGVDFSRVAIDQARERYRHLEFQAQDWVAGDTAGQVFDVVFSSNTLEHFHQPWDVLERVSRHARHAVAMLVPYQEAHPIDEHHASFWPDNVPVTLADGKVLVHMAARDVSHDQPTFWPGHQVLMVWADPAWLARLGLHADALTLDVAVPSTLAGLAGSVRVLASQLDSGLARLLELRTDGREEVARLRDALQHWLMVRQAHAGASQLPWTLAGQSAEAADARQLQAALDAIAPVLAESEALLAKQAELVGLSDQLVLLRGQLQELEAARSTLERLHAESVEQLAVANAELDSTRQALAAVRSEQAADRNELAGSQNALAIAQHERAVLQQALAQAQAEYARLLASHSWQLTRPLRVLRRLLSQPANQVRVVLDRLERRGGTSARFARKFRSGARFLRRSVSNGRIDPADRARLAQVLQQGTTAVRDSVGLPAADGPVLAPAGSKEDVFVWAVIDWHFRVQRPQHLAAALARAGHRVFYVSNNFVDSDQAGFHAEPLDDSGRLFQVNLHLDGAPQIYSQLPNDSQFAQLRSSLASLLGWSQSVRSFSIVQHPYWERLARCVPSAKQVYDCMDHHAGFVDNVDEVLLAEQRLVADSDLLVVTSAWLHDELAGKARNTVVIRNATDYEHFCTAPADVFRDPRGRKVIGYYGAIAEWFDPSLVRAVAKANPDALVLLIGRDTAGVAAQLADLDNVRMEGEVAYEQLPYWLYGFDVCLLPFQVIPLTLATNPVKVYEYLSAGKPVVSVDLPEMQQFGELVSTASDVDGFVAATGALLANPGNAKVVAARQEFAAQQTWGHRARDLESALGAIREPRVSVIVLTYNNLDLTKACLHSIEVNSDYPNLEVIAVDNASSDGTQTYLAEWVKQGQGRRFIANETNLGFSAGNNVGLAAATGDYLVILNNDTYVTPGWVRGLINQLRRHPAAGLVGPVTNNIGNEARIEISYSELQQMQERAGQYTRRHPGGSFQIETAAFFCVMLTRQAYEKVGPMDEQFGVGFFEDDDYCKRLHQLGFDVLCAEDVFVHHHLSASFNKLKAEAKQALFERNRALYEAKWGPWTPHAYRKEATM